MHEVTVNVRKSRVVLSRKLLEKGGGGVWLFLEDGMKLRKQ